MMSFLLGFYIAIAIIVGIIFTFFTILGGKSITLLKMALKVIFAAAFWPITLIFMFKK